MVGERGLAVEAFGVVAGGDEQRAGRLRPETVTDHQLGGRDIDQRDQDRVEVIELRVERVDPPGQVAQRELGGPCRGGGVGGAEPQRGVTIRKTVASRKSDRSSLGPVTSRARIWLSVKAGDRV